MHAMIRHSGVTLMLCVLACSPDEAAREELKEAMLAFHVLYSHALNSDDRESHCLAKARVQSTAEDIVRAIKKHELYEFRYHVEDGSDA